MIVESFHGLFRLSAKRKSSTERQHRLAQVLRSMEGIISLYVSSSNWNRMRCIP